MSEKNLGYCFLWYFNCSTSRLSMTTFFRACLVGLMAIWAASCVSDQKNGNVGPNVLFIGIDDLRPELNCYGASHIQSPYIDRLAGQGILFENAYCNIPVCGASRASILTGLRPTYARFKSYLTRADEDAPGVKTLPGLFKEHGYHTISNGKIFHNRDDSANDWDEIWRANGASPRDFLRPENIGLDTAEGRRGPPFERYSPGAGQYRDAKLAAKTISDLQKLQKLERPFFLAVGFMKPHLPFNAPAKYWDLYDSATIQLPNNHLRPTDVPAQALHSFGELRHYHGVPAQGPVSDPMAKKLIHGYYACVSYIDDLIGDIMNELEVLEMDQNTIIVLWGDHGWNLYEHGLWCKHCNYRTSLQVPLIFKLPSNSKTIRRAEMVEYVDIYPTLVELCQLPSPDHLQGTSLVNLMSQDPVQDWKSQVESIWHDGFTYTSKKYAYTEWRTETDSILAQMLFDHELDPDENQNLMLDPAAEQVVTEIKKEWEE